MKVFLKIALIILVGSMVVPAGFHTSYAEEALAGKVIETMDSGGYTYVHIENSAGKTWVAVPRTKVQKGQDISFNPGAEMRNFPSKTLNRTFDRIIFSAGVKGQGGTEKSPGSKGTAVTVDEKIKVDKAAGPDAYTVAEIFSKSKELQEKTVVVRGKVVKVSAGVMGKNWVHIQDGTGEAGSNDLVVTSDDLPKTGDVVTASGTLYNNKDFGSGYKYKVIVEKAKIKN
jgi:hypothetical protein